MRVFCHQQLTPLRQTAGMRVCSVCLSNINEPYTHTFANREAHTHTLLHTYTEASEVRE